MEAIPRADAALWAAFAANAAPLGTALVHAPTAEAAVECLAAAGGLPIGTTLLGECFPALAACCQAPGEWGQGAPLVVAPGEFAIAETGSVAVRAPATDRAACFLAEHLWLVVPVEAIVPTLEAALARVAALVRAGATHVTFMSGPSRTADIERTLTIGVHGPRALTVLVVGEA